MSAPAPRSRRILRTARLLFALTAKQMRCGTGSSDCIQAAVAAPDDVGVVDERRSSNLRCDVRRVTHRTGPACRRARRARLRQQRVRALTRESPDRPTWPLNTPSPTRPRRRSAARTTCRWSGATGERNSSSGKHADRGLGLLLDLGLAGARAAEAGVHEPALALHPGNELFLGGSPQGSRLAPSLGSLEQVGLERCPWR